MLAQVKPVLSLCAWDHQLLFGKWARAPPHALFSSSGGGRGSPIGFSNPLIRTPNFVQYCNPDIFFWGIPPPMILSESQLHLSWDSIEGNTGSQKTYWGPSKVQDQTRECCSESKPWLTSETGLDNQHILGIIERYEGEDLLWNLASKTET